MRLCKLQYERQQQQHQAAMEKRKQAQEKWESKGRGRGRGRNAAGRGQGGRQSDRSDFIATSGCACHDTAVFDMVRCYNWGATKLQRYSVNPGPDHLLQLYYSGQIPDVMCSVLFLQSLMVYIIYALSCLLCEELLHRWGSLLESFCSASPWQWRAAVVGPHWPYYA